MDIKTIRAAIVRKPFKPFQVLLGSGDSFRVDHPENIAVLESAATVFLDTSDVVAILDLDQIAGMTHEKARKTEESDSEST